MREYVYSKLMNSTVLSYFDFGMNRECFAAARLTWPAYNDGRKLKIALPEKIALLLHPDVDVPWGLVVTSPDFGWQIVSP